MCLECLRRKMQTQVLSDDNTEMGWGLPMTEPVLQCHRGRALPHLLSTCTPRFKSVIFYSISPLSRAFWWQRDGMSWPVKEVGVFSFLEAALQSCSSAGCCSSDPCACIPCSRRCPSGHRRVRPGESLHCQHPTCAGSHRWICNGCFAQCCFASHLPFLGIE